MAKGPASSSREEIKTISFAGRYPSSVGGSRAMNGRTVFRCLHEYVLVAVLVAVRGRSMSPSTSERQRGYGWWLPLIGIRLLAKTVSAE